VMSVPGGTVTLLQEPSGTASPLHLVCRFGTALVSCDSGPVSSVTVGPGAAWVPGQTYLLQVTSPTGAPITSTFTAPTGVAAGSAAISYRWATVRSAKAFGGSEAVASTRGSTESITFSGPTITWYGPTGPALGAVDVLVDGRVRASVNTRSTTARDRVAHVLTHLGPGQHTLTLRVRSGTVVIDAIRVGSGTVVATPALSATWFTTKAGASATLRFAGTGVRWATSGSATLAVFIDGHRTTNKSVTSLAAGQHTVRLVVLTGTLRLKGFQVTG
jgi:archaellum component FlaG (FlaF/FlaG flagellin family)